MICRGNLRGTQQPCSGSSPRLGPRLGAWRAELCPLRARCCWLQGVLGTIQQPLYMRYKYPLTPPPARAYLEAARPSKCKGLHGIISHRGTCCTSAACGCSLLSCLLWCFTDQRSEHESFVPAVVQAWPVTSPSPRTRGCLTRLGHAGAEHFTARKRIQPKAPIQRWKEWQ